MATNFDKAVYSAPVGIAAAQPDIEIEIEDPKSVTVGVDGMEVTLEPGEETAEGDFGANLAETLDDNVLSTLATDLLHEIDNDLSARKDWEKMYTLGIELMGLKIEERNEPWQGACGVYHPMIAEAVVRFQSETIMETFPASGPTKTLIVGKQTKEKEEAASRVKEDMNYQLTEKMPEFRPEHERMLFNLPGAGAAFKKVYFDPAKDRQVSLFIPAEDCILPYGYSDMHTAERVTHRMRKTKNEVEALQESGFWLDEELPDPPKPTVSDIQKRKDKESGLDASYDNRYVIYEVHALLKIDGADDDYPLALPYIVTIVKDLNKVLAVRRNWNEGDAKRLKRIHFVHYDYIPGFGPYGFGLFHLIGGYAKNATSIMRQLVDAGTLSNLPGGLKSRGLRIKGDDTPIAPGEFRDVDIGSGAIKDNILPLPYKEPSQVLAGLLDKIIDEGRRFGSAADLKVADMSNQAPVGSTLAILERTLKVMSAVQARVHYAFKQELQLIAGIVRDCTPDDYDYDVEAPLGRRAKREDYDHVEIIPVSDPNAATMSQRVVQYQAVVQLAATAPQIYDLPVLHRQMIEVLGVKNAAKLVPTNDDMKPVDPVQENQNALKGKPLKAFAYQDHEAHIAVHQMAMQDPLVQQIVGQNPQANAIMQAMSSHIAEHVGYAYRNRMAQVMGIEIPVAEDGEGFSPDVELLLSKQMAQAAPQILAMSQAKVAQQQAQQNAQDPLVQIEMERVAIEKAEVERKQKKDIMDAANKADLVRIAEEKLELEGLKQGHKMLQDKGDAQREDEKAGFQMGIDVAQAKHQQQNKE